MKKNEKLKRVTPPHEEVLKGIRKDEKAIQVCPLKSGVCVITNKGRMFYGELTPDDSSHTMEWHLIDDPVDLEESKMLNAYELKKQEERKKTSINKGEK